jgi:predicted RNA-binding protein YlqC (UPF0109 family)
MSDDNLVNLTKQILANIVEFPDELDIRNEVGNNSSYISIRANRNDVGKVIGKKGQTIHALRTIIRTVANKNEMRSNLIVID